ncbi:MAG: hypothetical protein ACLFVW_08565 [Phycisphaerae bacterium]
MEHDFSHVADDFYVNMELSTALELSGERETILQFFEAVQKQFPEMTSFFQRESGEYVLESDREKGSYRWLELQPRRLTAGYFNPPDLSDGYRLHDWLLHRSVFFLGVSSLDVEALDLIYGFNLDCQGNRDAVTMAALLPGSALGALALDESFTPIQFEPSLIVAVDPDCAIQARVLLETHSSSYQVRTGRYEPDPISVYLTVRGYPRPDEVFNTRGSLIRQCRVAEDLTSRLLVPHVIQPIASAIAAQ